MVVSVIQLGTSERLRLGPEDADDQRPEREREPDGDEDLLEGASVEGTDRARARSPGRRQRPDEEREHRSREETDLRRARELVADPPRRVRADRDEDAVREVEDAHEPVDERQAGGDEEVHGPEPEAGDRQQDEGANRPPPCTPRKRRTRSGSSRRPLRPAPRARRARRRGRRRARASRCRTARFCSTSTTVVSSADPLEHGSHLADDARSEPLRRLVDEQQRVPVEERAGDRHHLLLAARERPRALHRHARAGPGIGHRRARSRVSRTRAREAEVLGHGEAGEHLPVLGDVADRRRRTILCVGIAVTSVPSSVNRCRASAARGRAAPEASSSCRRRCVP